MKLQATCMKFFAFLNDSDIPYCHWKSNEHLDAALAGKTDLDILIEGSAKEAFVSATRKFGFVRFAPAPYLRYRSIEDFIGIDEEDGTLIHLHAHFALVVGKKFVKNYRLPWEAEIFRDRILFAGTPVYTVSPEIELLSLVVRRAAKDALSPSRLWRKHAFSADERRELAWLKQRCDGDLLAAKAAVFFPPEIAEAVVEALMSGGQRLPLRAFSLIRKRFLPGITASASIFDREPLSSVKYFTRKAHAAVTFIAYKKWSFPVPYRRSLEGGGVVIAFLGADGAGK